MSKVRARMRRARRGGVGAPGARGSAPAPGNEPARGNAPAPGSAPAPGNEPARGNAAAPGSAPAPGNEPARGNAAAPGSAPAPGERPADAASRPPPGRDPAPPPESSPAAARTPAGLALRHRAFALAALVAMVAASHVPALSGGFVWDDIIFSEEPVIHRWGGLWSIWLSPSDIHYEGHYWPIVYTTFWLEHKLWGLNPVGYHAVNIALHAANTVLAWRLMQRLEVPGAWAVAAVFAVHPLHVESVAWVIERKDLLSMLFYLGAVGAWIRFAEAPRPGTYLQSLGLYVAALLSKSIAVTLPAALLVWHWWKRGEVTLTDGRRLAPLFVVGLGIALADVAYYATRESVSLGYSVAERVLIAARAVWFYAGKLLWPTDLAVIYPLWDISAAEPLGWAFVAAAAALAAGLWLARHRLGRGPLAGAAFFVVTLSPTLGFVDYGYMQFAFVADRFQYLAGLGVMAVLVGGAVRAAGRMPRALRNAAAGGFAVVLALLGTLTWRHAAVYHDPLTLFGHIVSLNPRARDAHLNLSIALGKLGRAEEALANARIAVALRPEFAGAHANLGHALMKLELLEEAEATLRHALELDRRHKTARQNLAEALRRQGRYEEAVAMYGKVLARDPDFGIAHAGLGESLFRLGRYDEAAGYLGRALSQPLEADVAGTLRILRGQSLRMLGRFEAAGAEMRRALDLDPRDPRAFVELAHLRTAQARHDEADDYLRRARELEPADSAVRQNIAEGLRKRGRYAEAVGAYRVLLADDPDYAMAHAGMGDALFQLGRYEEALETLARSVELHPHPPTATARLILMGRAARSLGRDEEAVAHFERAVAIDPDNAGAIDHLAMFRFNHRRYAEALEFYRTLIESGRDSAQAHANLGATLFHLGRMGEALQSFEHALALDPDLEAARVGREQARARLERRQDPSPAGGG